MSSIAERLRLQAEIDQLLRKVCKPAPPESAQQAAERAQLRKVVFFDGAGGQHAAYLEGLRTIELQDQEILGGARVAEKVEHADLLINVKKSGEAPKWCSIQGVMHMSCPRRSPLSGGWMTVEELAGAEAGKKHTASLEAKRSGGK